MLYLSHSPRSRMSAPPPDLELDGLDFRRLNRLARAMRLSEQLESWLSQVGADRSIIKRARSDQFLSRR
jgi:hypothetical protein